jgi:CDP-glucose 4,6-dehydratase
MSAEWYRAYARGNADMRAFSEAQIARYSDQLSGSETGITETLQGETAICA